MFITDYRLVVRLVVRLVHSHIFTQQQKKQEKVRVVRSVGQTDRTTQS